LFQNNYYRTELGVKFDYAITSEIIDILHGEGYSLPKKSIAKDLGFIVGQNGIDAAIEKYPALKKDNHYFIDENEFNQLGKELNQNYGMVKESSIIYALAIQEYPNSFILNYSYGELLSGNKSAKALDYYRKCIQLYDKYSENKEFIKEYEIALKKINDN
jgi:hypothetical protein